MAGLDISQGTVILVFMQNHVFELFYFLDQEF
jgi:hypothetical protein